MKILNTNWSEIKNKCGVYKITSPNGRIYVGSALNINRRNSQYTGRNTQAQVKLFRSFKKYGQTNHTFEVVLICTEEDRLMYERIIGDHYKVIEEGLNCRLPGYGELSTKTSEETKSRLRKAAKKYRYKNSQWAIEHSRKMKGRISPHRLDINPGEILNNYGIKYIREVDSLPNTNNRRILVSCYCGNEFETNLCNIRTGRTKCCNRCNVVKRSKSRSHDTKYVWEHSEHNIECMTKKELIHKYNLTPGSVYNLANMKSKFHKGWKCLGKLDDFNL